MSYIIEIQVYITSINDDDSQKIMMINLDKMQTILRIANIRSRT